jgi:DNA-binding HxlR family transcriptional regulator
MDMSLNASPWPPARAPEAQARPGVSENSAASAPKNPLETTLELIGDRFKTLIVWHLFWGARPFCELMRLTDGISKKSLRQALVEMERHGLVRREVRRGITRRAEYALTPLGESLKLVVGTMYEWGLKQQQARPRRAPLSPVRELTPRA